MIHLSQYLPTIKIEKGQSPPIIWCLLRKKWLTLTSEEIVRQSAVLYLIDMGYSPRRISIERKIQGHQVNKRYDLVVLDKRGKGAILVECKAVDEPIHQATFDQAAAYNYSIASPIIWMTNGHSNKIFQFSPSGQLKSLPVIPRYKADVYLEEE